MKDTAKYQYYGDEIGFMSLNSRELQIQWSALSDDDSLAEFIKFSRAEYHRATADIVEQILKDGATRAFDWDQVKEQLITVTGKSWVRQEYYELVSEQQWSIINNMRMESYVNDDGLCTNEVRRANGELIVSNGG